MGHSSHKLLAILIISVLAPCSSFAQDSTENGSSFSFKSFLGGLFSSHTSTSDSTSTTNPGTDHSSTRANEISEKIIDRFDGSANQQSPTPVQNNYVSETQEHTAREGIVRCMYLGKFVEIHTGLSEQDPDAQIKAKRAGELYANLKCNEQLAGYEQVWKNVDKAIGNCVSNDDCQNLNPTANTAGTGGVQRLPVPVTPKSPTTSVGGIK